MRISLLVALAQNGVIGINNDLPWRLPDDLKWFKKNTLGKPIIMGRNTMESLGRRPLPGRKNIFISRHFQEHIEGFEHAASLSDAISLCGDVDEVCIIGGAFLYESALDMVDRMYITRVEAEPEGDTFFPEFNADLWKCIYSEQHEKDDRHAYAFRFEIWDRI